MRIAEWGLRLAVVVAVALALAGCSKCDVPTWNPNRTPASCHDDGALK